MKSLGLLVPLLACLGINACKSDDDSDDPFISDYEFPGTSVSDVTFSSGLSIAAFPDGLPLSIGSGLRVQAYNARTGETILYGMTDRGPNGDSPAPLKAVAPITATKVFPLPNFQPALLRMSYSPTQGLRILERIGLQDQGKAMSGRPIPPGSIGHSAELALNERLQPLPFDPLGIDPEGIDFDQDGHAWISDEYGPFLLQVDIKTGAILQRLGPGQGLPAVLAQRQPNRGFEGIAISDGKIYAIIQSTLDIAGQTKKIADFIRVVEYDPATRATRMFAYPIDSKAYSKNSDAKLGDLVALGSGRFAVIEQGTGADKAMHNAVYGIDLREATDLAGRQFAGKELEYSTLAQLTDIKPARKVFLADLRASGWKQEKAEGLTLLNGKTMMILSDNDFGLKAGIQGGPSTNLDDYRVDEQGTLFYQGTATAATYQIGVGETRTQMMILKADQDFAEF